MGAHPPRRTRPTAAPAGRSAALATARSSTTPTSASRCSRGATSSARATPRRPSTTLCASTAPCSASRPATGTSTTSKSRLPASAHKHRLDRAVPVRHSGSCCRLGSVLSFFSKWLSFRSHFPLPAASHGSLLYSLHLEWSLYSFYTQGHERTL